MIDAIFTLCAPHNITRGMRIFLTIKFLAFNFSETIV